MLVTKCATTSQKRSATKKQQCTAEHIRKVRAALTRDALRATPPPIANATDLLTPVPAVGWVKTTVLFFAVCGPKFTGVCQQTRERS